MEPTVVSYTKQRFQQCQKDGTLIIPAYFHHWYGIYEVKKFYQYICARNSHFPISDSQEALASM